MSQYHWYFATWGSAQLGYRWLATDYHTGSGRSQFVDDVLLQGPEIDLTIHFQASNSIKK